MIPMVLSRLTICILSTKLPQDITFIRRISGAVDDTSFRFALKVIYILFLALPRAIPCRGSGLRQGVLSSIIPDATRTVVIYPGRFFIRRFYYTLVNRFWNFYMLKHINILFKQNGFSIKALNTYLFRPDIMHDV